MLMKYFKRAAVMLIAVLLLVSSLTVGFTANAAGTKKEKTYEIAIAFDNSGSMYQAPTPDLWCKAKYAMEIFASMLDLDSGRNVLKVYPMWPVTTDGSKNGGSLEPVIVRSTADIDKLHKLYTPKPQGTPFTPVVSAHKELQASTADVKWLIVMTDGQIEGFSSADKLRDELLKYSSDKINVQYLGFGGAFSLDSQEDKHFYASDNDLGVQDNLIKICNRIFDRHELKGAVSGNKLELEISMSKLIIFVQGSDAKVSGLAGPDGPAQKIADSGQRKYSELEYSCGNRKPSVDSSLAGQVVTFASCKKGSYTIDMKDVDPNKIQVFYEPDVDVKITLTDSDGQVIDQSADTIPAGEYTINYTLVDAQTGEDVTNSKLMNPVKISGYVKQDDKVVQDGIKNGDKVTLSPGGNTCIHVEGTYLDRYRISTEDSGTGLSFSGGCLEPIPPLTAEIEVMQSSSWYCQLYKDEWKAIRVTFKLDGVALTDEQLAALKVTPQFSEDIAYRMVTVPGKSAVDIFIGQGADGQPIDIENTSYDLTVSGMILDDRGNECKAATEEVDFTVAAYPSWVPWLFWFIVFLILFLIYRYIGTRKAYPKKVVFQTEEDNEPINVKGGNFSVGGQISGTTKKVTNVFNRKKSTASFNLVINEPAGALVKSFTIGANEYRYNRRINGYTETGDNERVDFTQQVFQITDGTLIGWQEVVNRRVIRKEGTILINR